MAKAKKDTGAIELTRLTDVVLAIPVKGMTEIIPHKWSEKAKRSMPGHPDKETVKKVKEVRNPEQEAKDCLYFIDESETTLGIPATAFKAAIVGACRFFDKPTMVEAKQMLFVVGTGVDQLVQISGNKVLREDLVRLPNGSADLRYRYGIKDWSAIVLVRFVPQIISPESVVALADGAGRGGCGDWRPSAPKSHTGTYGTWRVDDSQECAVVEES